MKRKAESRDLLEPGTYSARLSGVQEDSSQYGPIVRLTFAVQSESGDVNVTGVAADKMVPGCKLRIWVESLLGRPLEEDEEIDLDDLIGTRCQLLVGTVVGNKGGVFNRIEKIIPRRVAVKQQEVAVPF